MTRPLGLAIFLVFVLSTAAFAFQPGEAAPVFSLKNLNGEQVNLADFKGRPVVLEISTTWCPGCRFQSKETATIADTYPSEEVGVLEVFIQETEESVREYVTGNGGHPELALLDDDTVLKEYLVYLIPRLLIIDKDGVIQYDGSLTKADDIIRMLKPLLNET